MKNLANVGVQQQHEGCVGAAGVQGSVVHFVPGRKKKPKKQIKMVSGLPGTMVVTFLQLAFTVNPFPPDLTQGDTNRHQEVGSGGGSREGMCQQHLAVPRLRGLLGYNL